MKLTRAMLVSSLVRGGLFALKGTKGARAQAPDVDSCPGYNAVNISNTDSGLKAELVLAGSACNVYGNDYEKLSLQVTYENGFSYYNSIKSRFYNSSHHDNRIHLKLPIRKEPGMRYQNRYFQDRCSHHQMNVVATMEVRTQILDSNTPPLLSVSKVRKGSNEVLFDTTGYPLVFEPQYLRIKTVLPSGANIYGLGEYTDPFRLPPENVTRTVWNRDALGVPPGTNLYNDHPIYFEHRTTGTHGVFPLNSNGMDIKLRSESDGNSLEYNVIGGMLDFYFIAGPGPLDVAQQYASLAGTPAEILYWGLGLHQCRYGYRNYLELAEVVVNYSAAGIPLETMWTNILMVDPAVGVRPGISGAYDRGSAANVWVKNPDGTEHRGLVWPGVTVCPDWFNNNTQDFWNSEFASFFSPETDIDIDGVWIDMNEPASFCNWPCADPFAEALAQGLC